MKKEILSGIIIGVIIVGGFAGIVYYRQQKTQEIYQNILEEITEDVKKNQEIIRDQNKIVGDDTDDTDTELIKAIPQCKTKNILEEVAFSDNLSARIEKCNDGSGTFSIISIIKNNKVETLKIREIKGIDDSDSPFYGFKNIKFLSENYLILDYSYWEITVTKVYDLQSRKNVLSFIASIKKTEDGKYFFVYGGGMASDPQLKVYSISSLELVKDFSNDRVPGFLSCSEKNRLINCKSEVDQKEYLYSF